MLLVLLISPKEISATPTLENESVIITVMLDEREGTNWEHLNTDTEPFMSEGVVYVPLRVIAEKFGYQVEYNDIDKKAIITSKNEDHLVLFVNSNDIKINGVNITMDQPPVINNDRLFIPLQYISDFSDLTVIWGKFYLDTVLCIWLSEVDLLTMDDVKTDHNYVLVEETIEYEMYELLESGITARSISIGDTADKVISVYGPAHKQIYIDSMQQKVISYLPPGDPFELSAGYIIHFYIADNKVTKVVVLR